jgi:hypothetical protein
MRSLPLIAVLLVVGWTAPAAADTFTATWDFHLQGGEVPDPNPTPFYDCDEVFSGGLFCSWLWEQGLEVTSTTALPLYGDGGPFYDAFGDELPFESDIPQGGGFGAGLLQIAPACRPGLSPCFETFTPLHGVADAFLQRSPGGVFFTSSRGGVVTSPDGVANFAGPQWTDIAWMYVGLYIADECADPEADCSPGEQQLSLENLTFAAEPIPEPAAVLLVGSGLLALVRRYRRRT